MKQVIVVRTDLKLSKGKLISQACHASLEAYKKAGSIERRLWEFQGQKKVVLKVKSKKALTYRFDKAKEAKIACSLIKDAGKTQIPSGTITCLGIGPAMDHKIDKIVGSLKLL